MENRNCIKCQKEVLPEENHIKLEEYRESELKNINFIHNTCWKALLETKSKVEESMGYLRGMMNKLGINPTQVVEV